MRSASKGFDVGAPRILVVDDEPVILDVIGHLLRLRGDVFDLAPDGPEALELLRQNGV